MGKKPPAKDWKTEGVILKLQDAYDLALKQSETLAIQKQEVKRTNAEIYQALGDAIGDVHYKSTDFIQEPQGSGGSGEGSSVGSTFNASERRERKFTVNQPLFQGFRSLGALTGSGTLRRQRTQDVQRAKELLFIDTANAFYTLLQEEKDLRTTEGIRDLFSERIGDLKEREEIGRSRTSEIASSVSSMKTLEADLAREQGDVKIAREQLAFLTGIPAELIHLQDEEVPPGTTEFVVDEAVEERADVESARQAVKTAFRAVIVAQSDFWPQIDLEVNQYDKREGFQSGIDWDTLFTIDIPIFTGGTTYGIFRESVVDWKQAKLNYEWVRRKASLEIKTDHQNWLTSVEENKAMQEASKAAQENYRLQKDEYEKNLVNNLDVLEALRSFFVTSKEANQAYYDMKKNYWKFQISIGEVYEVNS